MTRTCAVCERTLLLGERAVRFAPSPGAELVDVCPLCQEVALDAGWIKEGSPTTPTINSTAGDGACSAAASASRVPPRRRRSRSRSRSFAASRTRRSRSSRRPTSSTRARTGAPSAASSRASASRKRASSRSRARGRARRHGRVGSLVVPVPRQPRFGPADPARAPRLRGRRARAGLQGVERECRGRRPSRARDRAALGISS